MPRTSAKLKTNNLRVFEDAREVVIKLETLSRLLTPVELETLEILFDKRATALIAKSLKEAEQRDLQPISKIL
jgi:DNA replication protein DnaD